MRKARQLVGDRQAVRNVGRIRGFRPRRQVGQFGLQLRLDLAGVLVGQIAPSASMRSLSTIPSRSGARSRALLKRQKPHVVAGQFEQVERTRSPRDRSGPSAADAADRKAIGRS